MLKVQSVLIGGALPEADKLLCEGILPKLVTDSDVIKPFAVRRLTKEYGNVCVAPRVTSVALSPLNVPNIKYIAAHQTYGTDVPCSCSMHEFCEGHLRGPDPSRIGLPSFIVGYGTDEDIMDPVARSNSDFIKYNLSHEQFVSNIRKSMMGKTGTLRNKQLGVRPSCSCRGVATCRWSGDPRIVSMPRQWMKKMKVRLDNTSESGLKSTIARYREVRDYDNAILLRCPVIGPESIQPVKVMPWDNDSIGVHPAMCSPLNLDYDGDEVHVIVLGLRDSVEEITAAMNIQSNRLEINHSTLCRTTRALEDLPNSTYLGKEYSLAKCKEGLRKLVIHRIDKSFEPYTYVERSVNAIHQLTSSHLYVSRAHTFGRQLKNISLCTRPTKWGYVPEWIRDTEMSSLGVIQELRKPDAQLGTDTFDHGYPGCRLSSRLSGVVMQHALDMAKHTVGKNVAVDILMSLFSSGTNHMYVLSSGKIVYRNSKPRAPVKYTSDRRCVSRITPLKTRLSCFVKVLVELCMKLEIPYTPSEVLDLASTLYCASQVQEFPDLTSYSPVSFLTKVGMNFLVSTTSDSLHHWDTWDKRESTTNLSLCEIRNPIVAVCVGNLSGIWARSCTRR